jgi:DNA adenine methylase
MQPLLKWPGGKQREYPQFKDLIPKFDRYIEPFFGGGAVYFQLQPRNAVINDITPELISFYRHIKGELDREAFREELDAYAHNWDNVPRFLDSFNGDFHRLYHELRRNTMSEFVLRSRITKLLTSNLDRFNGLFKKEFCADPQNLLSQIEQNLSSKLVRMRRIESTHGNLSQNDLNANIETAFRSGFYMHFRDLLNNDTALLNEPKRIANWYFIREFCYGSMFRFNGQGKFNIPYGGIAYNKKRFKTKLAHILSAEVQELFQNTSVNCFDFEELMTQLKLSSSDFIFLDPPYDTDFSNYNNHNFGKNDQIRLAQTLHKTAAQYLMVIKYTPFIFSLYENKPGVNIQAFSKQYAYNVKGRNDRDVQHLIITNYPPSKPQKVLKQQALIAAA